MARSPLLIESCAPKVPVEENLLRIRESWGDLEGLGKLLRGGSGTVGSFCPFSTTMRSCPPGFLCHFGVYHLHHNKFSFFTPLYVDPLQYGHQKG